MMHFLSYQQDRRLGINKTTQSLKSFSLPHHLRLLFLLPGLILWTQQVSELTWKWGRAEWLCALFKTEPPWKMSVNLALKVFFNIFGTYKTEYSLFYSLGSKVRKSTKQIKNKKPSTSFWTSVSPYLKFMQKMMCVSSCLYHCYVTNLVCDVRL